MVTARYAVRVPDWDPARLDVDVSVDAQQVHVAGQVLTAVNGTVGYTDRLVKFDATGTDGERGLEARGTLRLEDALQRLTLEHAQIARNGVEWALAPGSAARVAITGQQATVGTLELARGDQRTQFEGTVGIAEGAESSLRVEATGVDIGDLLTLASQDVDAPTAS